LGPPPLPIGTCFADDAEPELDEPPVLDLVMDVPPTAPDAETGAGAV